MTGIRRLPLLAVMILLLSSVGGCQGEDNSSDEDYDNSSEDDHDEKEYDRYMSMRISDLQRHFNCDEIFAQPRPVHSEQDWTIMREAYQSVVGLDRSSLNNDVKDGFAAPVQVRQAGKKGRGVFVINQVVRKGQLVWSHHKTARFAEGAEYRIFLARIRPDFACDVLQWAYVESLDESSSKTDQAFISVDMDAASFINAPSGDENPNIGCDPEAAKAYQGGCKDNEFALRDIQVDEELLLDYSEFAILEGWEWFGLQ